MKVSMMIMMGLCCILLIGCPETVETGPDRHSVNSQLIKSYSDIAIENAIISQHTLFPYHFVKNSAELNELGQRDFATLTKHFVKHAGQLNIRRANTPADLYQARVKSALDGLRETGVDMERIRISDDMPGGSGMASERILIVLQQEQKDALTRTSTTYQSGMR